MCLRLDCFIDNHPLIFSLVFFFTPFLYCYRLCLSDSLRLVLSLTAKPKNTAGAVTAVAGTKPAVVARCQSANGRPEALISWVTTANGNASTVSKTGADNTVTVVSEYLLVPTAADNGKDISCVVTHRTLTKPESFPMKLAVECESAHAGIRRHAASAVRTQASHKNLC